MDAREIDHGEIAEIVDSINHAWQNGQIENLYNYFHESVVFTGPDFSTIARGAESCISSFREFSNAATIHSFTIEGLAIETFNSQATAGYHFEIAYEMGDSSYHEKGSDLLFFTREQGKWQVIWRRVTWEDAAG